MFGFIKRFITKEEAPIIEPTEPRMYLILREDLAYKYIQGAHALSNFAIYCPLTFYQWGNKYLICLSTFNGLTLKHEYERLKELHICSIPFFEPDLESDLPTAIAVYEDGRGIVKDALSHLKLATK